MKPVGSCSSNFKTMYKQSIITQTWVYYSHYPALHFWLVNDSHVSQTSVAAENLLINNCSNGQTIKAVCEGLPELYVEPAFALIKKTKKQNVK